MTSEQPPLSWQDARLRLRDLLEGFLDEPQLLSRFHVSSSTVPSASASATASATEDSLIEQQNKESLISWAVNHNLDLYFGSVPLSIALLILASFSLAERHQGGGPLHPEAPRALYRTQVGASCLLVLGSLMSLWMLRRSAFLRRNDSYNTKRRKVYQFLQAVKNFEEDDSSPDPELDDPMGMKPEDLPNLSGTALTDIYPVYRKLSENKPDSAWTRLPSLLLVQGDYIALQVGDYVPADCELVECPAIQLKKGIRISLDSFGQMEEEVMAELPHGRSTLPTRSEHLLTLCNRIKVFRIREAPMETFIRRPASMSKASQAWRQMHSVRISLLVVAPIFLGLTALVVLIRPGATSGDLSLILPLPLLAGISICPVVGPAFVFYLEVLGTARILATIHPFAVRDADSEHEEDEVPSRLLMRYILRTTFSRLSLWHVADFFRQVQTMVRGEEHWARHKRPLVNIPPASHNLLEKLGVCTALALVDDELACEPHAMPQQLLIPTGHGLKLLDLCRAYEDDDVSEIESSTSFLDRNRRSFDDSDSDSDDAGQRFHTNLRRKILRRRLLRRMKTRKKSNNTDNDNHSTDDDHDSDDSDDSSLDVQFEDPLWWQHLPSLKCIGLSCMLVNEAIEQLEFVPGSLSDFGPEDSHLTQYDLAQQSLINLVCNERRIHQLNALAECIGLSNEPNSFGKRGDITPFKKQLRLQVISDSLFRERLLSDTHERSSEQSRWWGFLRTDATSVIVQDARSGAYQLLTVGDPLIVANLCNEAWQGEILTILPLAGIDKQTILETSMNWKLADLDVAAFSYSPLPHKLEQRLIEEGPRSQVYLLDHGSSQSILKDKSVSKDWSLIRNQVFLGMLGSLVVPRREIQKLLSTLSDAGVRFVYFSPRNMRRQKELASQMGIDVAWNCAISLRPLESGEEDPHRMVSNYADWDVNAKLPHGVEDVRKHLQEVDNVPLLVSLFTDVTKSTTRDMVEIFQEYNDTVMAIGLSHLPRNDAIFSTADIAVGIDVLIDESVDDAVTDSSKFDESRGSLLTAELDFVSAISAHACVFRFRGASSLSHVYEMIEQGRAALEASTAAGVFLITGSFSYAFFVLFSVCAPSTTIPFVPTLGSVLYLQFMLPCIGLAMAMTESHQDTMKRVPPKNETNITFGRRERTRLYQIVLLKSILPALLPQFLHLVCFGELVIHMEPELITTECGGADHWVDVIRCPALKEYSGPARTSSGVVVFTIFTLVIIFASSTFVDRFDPLLQQIPWERNLAWVVSVLASVVGIVIYAALAVNSGSGEALPWYVYVCAMVFIVVGIVWNEGWKRMESRQETRAEKLRRLQFETRLGAWSPK